MENKEGYNGWSNYETWATKLWLDNEPGTVELQREWAAQARDVGELASMIRDFVEEYNPIADNASMYADLLGAAISMVDWYEIAESIMGDQEGGENSN